MINCDKCKCEIKEENGELANGKFLVFKNGEDKYETCRCNDCFEKDKSFNFQKCEVYSRVVGYIRPVQQWHKGKQAEYGDRIVFKEPN